MRLATFIKKYCKSKNELLVNIKYEFKIPFSYIEHLEAHTNKSTLLIDNINEYYGINIIGDIESGLILLKKQIDERLCTFNISGSKDIEFKIILGSKFDFLLKPVNFVIDTFDKNKCDQFSNVNELKELFKELKF